jgi:RimJ/RimL family protein N-acetyltransferase
LTTTSPTPRVETPRLVLRGHLESDLDDCAAMWGDATVTRHIGGKPFSRSQTWSLLLRYIGHWVTLGYGYWVVRERDSGAFVGEVGLADMKRDITPRLDAPEMGWALAPHAQGRGLAAEAVQAALAWGEAHLPDDSTVCIIDPGNARSSRLAAKLGYREIDRRPFAGDTTVVYRRPRSNR